MIRVCVLALPQMCVGGLIGIISSMEAYRMDRLCHPSVFYIVCQHFQTNFLKPLDQSSPNFSCGIREMKFEQTVPERQIKKGVVVRIIQR